MNFDGVTGLENPAIGPNGILKGASAAIVGGRLSLPNTSSPAEPTGRGMDLPLGPFAYALSGGGDFRVAFDYQNNNNLGGILFSADGSKYLFDHPELYDTNGDNVYSPDDDMQPNQRGMLNIYLGGNDFVGHNGLFADLWWLGAAGYTVTIPNPTDGSVNFFDTNVHHVEVEYTAATGEFIMRADHLVSDPFIVQGYFGQEGRENEPVGFFRDTSHDIIRLGDGNNQDMQPDITPPPNLIGYSGKFDNLIIEGPLPPPFKLIVDRATGSMDVQVISALAPQVINSISIYSPAGTLIPANDLGFDSAANPTFDNNDVWAKGTATSTQITESDTPGGSNNGATINVGQMFTLDNGTNGIWKPFFREDVSISAFDQTLGIEIFGIVEYVGEAVLFGDMNLDGAIDSADYVIFRDGFNDSIAGMTFYDAYFRADLNDDGKRNIDDFNAFVTVFDAENGSGSFALMLAGLGVPEPSSLALFAIGSIFAFARRRRSRFASIAIPLIVIAATSALPSSDAQAAELVKYQFGTNFSDTSGNGRNGVPHAGEIFGSPPTVSGGKMVMTGDVGESLGVPLGVANPFGGTVDYTIEMKFKSSGSSFNPNLGLILLGSANPVAPEENDNESLTVWVDPQSAGGALVIDYELVGQVTVPNAMLLDNVEHSITMAYDAPDDPGDVNDPNPGWMYLKVDGVWRSAGQLAPRPPAIDTHDVRIGASLNPLYPYNIELEDDSLQQVRTEFEGTIDDFRVLDTATLPTLLRAEVDLSNGEVTLFGGELARSIRYYEITSEDGSLLPAGWNSLRDHNLDTIAPGTGIGQRWDELVASTSQLAEGFLLGNSLFDQTDEISLGNIFKTSGDQDLKFMAMTADRENLEVHVTYINAPSAVPGDYNGDNVVNAADYTVWRNNLGDASEADINNAGDGVGGVTSADYTWWKARYGNTSGAGAGGIASVPEPSAIVLVGLCGGLVALTSKSRRRQIPSKA